MGNAKTCSACQRQNRAKALYCDACGRAFPNAEKPKKPIPGLPKECPNCFGTNSSYAVYCYKCGLKQPGIDEWEAYEDPDTARLYSYKFLRNSRWISLFIFFGIGVPVALAITEGWLSDRQSTAALFLVGTAVLGWEIFLYAFSAHVNIRMKPSSERMYDLYRWLVPAIRFLKPVADELSNRLLYASGKITGREYEERTVKVEKEREDLAARVRQLEAEIDVRDRSRQARVIRPGDRPPTKKEGGTK